MTDEVLVDTSDHIATITLNRPDRLNAISGPMLRELSRILVECDARRDVRAIVLTGAGRGFCAGLDLQAVSAGGLGGGSDDAGSGGGAPPTRLDDSPPFVLRRLDTPVLCGLNGPAAGYGMDMALGCDLIVASEHASMSPPIQRGVVPESGGTWLLPRLIGWQRACEVAMLGDKLRADDLARLGLVNAVVPADDFDDTVREWARRLARQAPLAMQATKRSMRLGLDASFDANAHHVMAEFRVLSRTKDFAEGVAAFVEKRDPRYEGR
ncbi:enoyl-CoA hydratase/isomerase family protein [Actinomarinicola tropica]|uniref:Enoyl-CoA hydratase/isomerase family protein n=1 Tax=Actinomarinicola tropica TaxID=2789776 RepID=A0A5Q2RIN4_9ACTN|nr:enoyl-CoA hydratase-related protein [Actinomarinicola tropica]QGG93700.1 enoyl-CoA hydratase/isomerase family protein [Actinomarinicola tropica]